MDIREELAQEIKDIKEKIQNLSIEISNVQRQQKEVENICDTMKKNKNIIEHDLGEYTKYIKQLVGELASTKFAEQYKKDIDNITHMRGVNGVLNAMDEGIHVLNKGIGDDNYNISQKEKRKLSLEHLLQELEIKLQQMLT